jgi:hypothetical protein
MASVDSMAEVDDFDDPSSTRRILTRINVKSSRQNLDEVRALVRTQLAAQLAGADAAAAADRATGLERAIQNADRTRAAYKTLFESKRFSDITVVIGDREAKLHKCVLSSCEYFERMLSTEFKEAAAKEVKLEVAEDSSAGATLLAIEYIYSGYVDISDSVMEVLAAADKLQLTHLRDHCVSRGEHLRGECLYRLQCKPSLWLAEAGEAEP